MKGLKFTLPLLAGACLGACSADSPVDSPAPLTVDAARPVELDQVRSHKKQLEDEAMRGLLYGSGRVEIDAAVAPELVATRDADEARRELARGYELLAANRRNDAVAAMTRAVLLAPERADGYEGLGDALINRRKYSEAGAAFRTALELDPGSASLHFKWADVLVRGDDRAGAIEELRVAAGLDPQGGEIRERLAIQLYYTNQPDLAWREVQRAEELGHPVPPQFRALLAGRLPEPQRESEGN
jgi:tetratricopeptide (TPR) repeat protein